MKIIAYSYEAGEHCPSCTRKATARMKLDHNHPYSMVGPCKDDNGIEYDFTESNGNLIHPVFSTDTHRPTTCDTCQGGIE